MTLEERLTKLEGEVNELRVFREDVLNGGLPLRSHGHPSHGHPAQVPSFPILGAAAGAAMPTQSRRDGWPVVG